MQYKKLLSDLGKFIPSERLFSDELRTFAYGTDASFYRLTPKIVVKAASEYEVVSIIKKCDEYNIPLTFRASGTSLSGQSISDSVLLVADRSWNKITISEDNSRITLDPSVLGAQANLALSKYSKKIGPDPASINAATVVGIASNNASGMTSGTRYNSYNTVVDMRIVFANGFVLNTGDIDDRERFIRQNRALVVELLNIANEIETQTNLLRKIVDKYKIKNTTGYGINSFVDYQDPIEIIKHLMIGSEGTLGFISEITLRAVPYFKNRATALVLFPDVSTACSVIPILQKLPIEAAEIMDRASLKSVEDKKGMPEYLKTLDENVAALLIETTARTPDYLVSNINEIKSKLSDVTTVLPVEFSIDPAEYMKLWNVRKGLFTSVSKSRPEGTTVVIEDVNFDTEKLADAVTDLQQLFLKHDYEDTIIWGHALSGNIHFVFAQDFSNKYEVIRYRKLMDDIVLLVIDKYDGSLKAEHGTGRNMAPFVKYEWGKEIYELMVRTKKALDPKGILNPGVLINNDDEIYIKNLKPTPIVHHLIDKCIDCGFCENTCPSKNLTLTPRQRISVWREINQLKLTSANSPKLNRMIKDYSYYGEETCATDGLCELSCPVDIDTGKLIKTIRFENHSSFGNKIASLFSKKLGTITLLLKYGLNTVAFIKQIIGENAFSKIADFGRTISFGLIPQWNKYLPKGSKAKFESVSNSENVNEVVYFPSCISRTMGNYDDSRYEEDHATVMQRLFRKAGYKIIYPDKLNSLCCGMPFSSKGFNEQAEFKQNELYNALHEASNYGQIPIVFDSSPCTKTFAGFLKKNDEANLKIFDSVEFIADKILDRIKITKRKDKIALHSTCSTTKMELTDKLIKIAEACVEEVHIPENINCCGFAGDRGFTYPELNKSALNGLHDSVVENNCSSGYSSSRTCEIGLSLHSGIEYNSIAFLVDECSEAETNN